MLDLCSSVVGKCARCFKGFFSAYTHSLAADTAEKAAQSDETTRRLTSLRVSNELDVKEQELALSIEREVAAKASQSLMDLTQWESSMDC